MTRLLGAVTLLLAGFGAPVVACGSHANGSAPGAGASGDDASIDGEAVPPPVGTSSGPAEDAASAPQAFLRVAALSPDMPSVDVCVAPQGTSLFVGPLIGLLGAQVGGEDGAVAGLSFPQVSAYLSLPVGSYAVRLVAAGASDCSSPLPLPSGLRDSGDDAASVSSTLEGDESETDVSASPDEPDDSAVPDATALAVDASMPDATMDVLQDAAGTGIDQDAPGTDIDSAPTAAGGVADTTNLPPLEYASYSTLIVAGDFVPAAEDRGLTVALLADDAVLAGGAVVLRAVNALPSVASLDFGLGSFEASWLPLLTDVTFGAASAQPGSGVGAVDRNGYLPISPLSDQVLSARASSGATADTAVADDVTIEVGSIATVIAVGGKTGDAVHPPALLLCIDNQPSGGLLSDCSIAP